MLEQFARLNAKTASLKISGNLPLLDVTDLCGVLALLDEHHSWYIYAMIEQRRAYNMELLHKYIQQLVMQEMRKREFKSRKVKLMDFAYGVTKAALFAHFNPRGKCKVCNGLGFKAAKRCEHCNGKGTREYNWSEKVQYGFPNRRDLTRDWYRKSCGYYDQFIESILHEIAAELSEKLNKVRRQAIAYKRLESAVLFDDDL